MGQVSLETVESASVIVPTHWAEARLQARHRDRQVTVRRFGWSDASQAEAQAMADSRAGDALRRIVAGETLVRREPKVPYNGADGVPIREEIVERHGEVVITRNSYGARCLNAPDVLFADVDAEWTASEWLLQAITIGAAILGITVLEAAQPSGVHPYARAAVMVAIVIVAYGLRLLVGNLERRVVRARKRVAAWVAGHPGWAVRLYRTPSGLRVMATHRRFAPGDPIVTTFFDAIGVDAVYARMSANQRCFRARLTPKPWRIGIETHLKPRPGVWPVAPERRLERDAWIARYEAASTGYAACRFLESLGTGTVHIDIEMVRRVHDEESKALQDLPIA